MPKPPCPKCGSYNVRRATAAWQCNTCLHEWQQQRRWRFYLNGSPEGNPYDDQLDAITEAINYIVGIESAATRFRINRGFCREQLERGDSIRTVAGRVAVEEVLV